MTPGFFLFLHHRDTENTEKEIDKDQNANAKSKNKICTLSSGLTLDLVLLKIYLCVLGDLCGE